MKCGLIWSLNIQTPSSGGGRKPSCQFYMEYLRHLPVTGDEALLQSVSKHPAEKHTAPWVPCSAPPGAATEPPGLPLPGTSGWRDLQALGWGFPSRRAAMAVLPLRTRQLRTCLIYQLHLKSSTTRTNILQFPLLQLLHSLCLNY